jgi:hypothetical protein
LYQAGSKPKIISGEYKPDYHILWAKNVNGGNLDVSNGAKASSPETKTVFLINSQINVKD